jgi:hypothetical protein
VWVCLVWLAFVCVKPRLLCVSSGLASFLRLLAPMLVGVSLVPLCNDLIFFDVGPHAFAHLDGCHLLSRLLVAIGGGLRGPTGFCARAGHVGHAATVAL